MNQGSCQQGKLAMKKVSFSQARLHIEHTFELMICIEQQERFHNGAKLVELTRVESQASGQETLFPHSQCSNLCFCVFCSKTAHTNQEQALAGCDNEKKN
jgi:hypothetical protein